MIKLKNRFFLLILLAFSSCKTYNTFYGVTDTLHTFNKKSKRLDLSYQDLNTIPERFNTLNELKMLDLSGNTDIDVKKVLASLPHPEKLEVLLLDSLNLSILPANISLLKTLKQLSLAYNPNLNLKTTFTQLYNVPLEFLNLKGNEIQKLPKNIQNIETLKDLNLSYNHLHDEESYSDLGKLPLLYSLWLDHNSLTQLPKTIKALDQISYFYIDNNELSSLPEEISEMKNLNVIHLGYNKFTEFPEQFIKVPSLKMVHINNNLITSFPRKYATEKYSLLALLLDHNPIPETEQIWAKKTFKIFFLLSFKQDY